MPYCEPHHTARARIIDLEVMRLELRANARPLTRGAVGGRATIAQFRRDHAPAPHPDAA